MPRSAPPPPIPSSSSKSAPPAPPIPSSSSNGSQPRGALLDQIHQGKTLRHVDESSSSSSSSSLPNTTSPLGLADTLAKAMESRRNAIKTEGPEEEGEEEEWS